MMTNTAIEAAVAKIEQVDRVFDQIVATQQAIDRLGWVEHRIGPIADETEICCIEDLYRHLAI